MDSTNFLYIILGYILCSYIGYREGLKKGLKGVAYEKGYKDAERDWARVIKKYSERIKELEKRV